MRTRVLLAVVMLLHTASARAQQQSAVAIVGAKIADGNGGPALADGTIVIQGQRITAVGPRVSVAVPRGARVIEANGRTVTPGFIDTNVHVSLYSGVESLVRYEDRFTDLVVEHAQLHLKHGITTVRDSYGMLGPLVDARDRIARGEAVGPRLMVAGNIVGWGGPWSFTWSGVKPSGLSLFQEQMNDAITRGSGEELLELGPDSLRAAINRYLDLGPDFIKMGGTGHYSNPVMISFSERAQQIIVDETHKRNRFAETHSTTEEGLRISVVAGVDVVQHPEVLPDIISDELVTLFRDRGVVCSMLVNTMTGKPWQEWSKRREAELKRQAEARDTAQQLERAKTSAELRAERGEQGMQIRRDNAKRLIAGGCVTTVGTDNYLGSAPEFRRTPKPEHQNAGIGTILAIEGLVELGMTPAQAIVSATRNGAMAANALNDFGTIEAGKRADLLMFDADPLADITNIRKLAMVMRDGVIVDTGRLPDRPVFHAPKTSTSEPAASGGRGR
ncbi:MAG: amidohydrolase family protein [Gemmatimonadetes bacterium]|nr:amidohydrolase family protein [Gemmatimonadota bacterium]